MPPTCLKAGRLGQTEPLAPAPMYGADVRPAAVSSVAVARLSIFEFVVVIIRRFAIVIEWQSHRLVAFDEDHGRHAFHV